MQITGILKTSREEKIILDTDNLPKLLIYKLRVTDEVRCVRSRCQFQRRYGLECRGT